MRQKYKMIMAAAAIAVTAATGNADYVNFTGLGNSGGNFTTAIGGGSIPTVNVSPIGGTGTSLSLSSTGNGTYLRVQDNSPITTGDTMFTTISFPGAPQIFSVRPDAANSNISPSGEQWVRFTAVNSSLSGFAWNLTGLTNGTAVISGANNEIITITPTAGAGPGSFTAFNLSPNAAISGVTFTVSSVPTSPFNSAQIRLDVIPEPSSVGLLALAGIGAWLIRARGRSRRLAA